MDHKSEVSDFLTSRRARITSADAGLAHFGGKRHVPGLRRAEVAMLTGISVEYHTRMERGNLRGVSDSVLDALSLALRLDDTERTHLYTLARAATPPGNRRTAPRPVSPTVGPAVSRMIAAIHTLPAVVTNHRFDVLLTNTLGRALYSEMYADPTCANNTARFTFLSPAARRFYVDWDLIAQTAVGALRVEATRNPYDRDTSNLIGELSTRSETFRTMWAAHDIRVFRDGTKRFNHPAVGRLDLDHETMFLSSSELIGVAVYSAAPDSPSNDALTLLATSAASDADAEPTHSPTA